MSVQPVRTPNANLVPSGHPARVHPNNTNPGSSGGLVAENDAAAWLAQLGFDVVQSPTVANGPVTRSDMVSLGLRADADPDKLVNGLVFDTYSPTSPSARNIHANIRDNKLGTGQTRRVIVNISDSTVDPTALLEQFADWPMTANFNGVEVAMEEAIFLRNGQVVGHWVPELSPATISGAPVALQFCGPGSAIDLVSGHCDEEELSHGN